MIEATNFATEMTAALNAAAREGRDVDLSDADRAATIVEGLGALDLGQGAVVAQGLCIAVETLPGTGAMLWLPATNGLPSGFFRARVRLAD